jgi:hypothetical protein
VLGTIATVSLLADQTVPLVTPKQETQQTTTTGQPPEPPCDEACQQGRQNLDIQQKLELFTGVLALIGALQGILLYLTWRTIARQANLQKFLTRQWVDVGNWSIGGESAWEIDDWEDHIQSEEEKLKSLKKAMRMGISFEIINRTAYPLNIDSIVIFIGKPKGGKWIWKTFEDKTSLIMPPHSPEGSNAESCNVPFDLDEYEVYRYTKSGLYTRIHIRVFYFDSEGKRIRQDFAQEALFGERLTTAFYKYSNRELRKIEIELSDSPQPSTQEAN